jgi:lantibiotic transport system ATP-binding protein
MYCIETVGLSHQYSKNGKELDDINLHVKEGSIYGFLGPNGAGKTTTLRLILGLLKKQQGQIRVFGKDFEKNRLEILAKVGSLIETPSIYGHLTAAENLLIWQKIYQCPRNRISEVLQLVGLADTGNKKAGQFSLGMKQRLSIAVSLLHSPSLLILDEPTNGLDPSGMIEVRELLKNLNTEHGITVIVSSHLLAEIEKLVTDVGIINKGKMLFEGPLDELMRRQYQASSLSFDTTDNPQALKIITAQQIEARLVEEKVILPYLSKQTVGNLNRLLIQNGLDVFEIKPTENDLESIFMTLTNNH